MKILGINFEQHDSGAAIVVDGKIIAAVNEERFSRRKIDNSAPVCSIKFCLKEAGLAPEDLNLVVLSGFKPLKKFLRFGGYYRDIARFAGKKSLFFAMFSKKGEFHFIKGIKALCFNLLAMTGLPTFVFLYLYRIYIIKKVLRGYRKKMLWVDHHIGHMASAYYTSGFKDCLCVIIEGMDWENTMVIEEINGGKVRRICATKWPHSAGYFYELVTMILGFNPYLDAGKITGLAAYGNHKNIWDRVSALMWTEGMELRVSPLIYILRYEYALTKKIPTYFRNSTPEDIAAAFQIRLEECIIEIVKSAIKKTGHNNLVLAGGVSGNVRLNQKIHELQGCKNIFIHPAMSDTGQALGVALWADNKYGDFKSPITLSDVYLGPEYSDRDIEKELLILELEYSSVENMHLHIAQLLSEGYVVARYNGRMEYGPRALGNRSILYQTTDPDVNNWLNKRLKRTEFMPFGPVCLIEDAEKYFYNLDGAKYTAMFMTITFNCTKLMKDLCPAAVHVDMTARPQLVSLENNPDIYRIINEYKKITGISLLINTSFNMHGEPIVLTPNDAIRCFLDGNLDYLAIGKYIVSHPALKNNKQKDAEGKRYLNEIHN